MATDSAINYAFGDGGNSRDNPFPVFQLSRYLWGLLEEVVGERYCEKGLR
jgi:hypothetical protein